MFFNLWPKHWKPKGERKIGTRTEDLFPKPEPKEPITDLPDYVKCPDCKRLPEEDHMLYTIEPMVLGMKGKKPVMGHVLLPAGQRIRRIRNA